MREQGDESTDSCGFLTGVLDELTARADAVNREGSTG